MASLQGSAKPNNAPPYELKTTFIYVTHLFVRTEGAANDCIVCVQGRSQVQSGDKLFLHFDEKHTHLFDKESERSVMGRTIGQGENEGE